MLRLLSVRSVQTPCGRLLYSYLDPSSRQCVEPHCVNVKGVFGYEEHSNASTTTLQSRHGPVRFFLFPRIKSDPKGNHFGTIENVQAAVTRTSNSVYVKEFQRCYRQWQQHWTRCIDSQGNYFENYEVCLNLISIKVFLQKHSHYFPDKPCITCYVG